MTNEAMTSSISWRIKFYQMFYIGSALILSIVFVGNRLFQNEPVSWGASAKGKIWPFLFMSLACSAFFITFKASLLTHVRRKSKTSNEVALDNKVIALSLLWCAMITATIGFYMRGSLLILLLGWGFPIVAYGIGRRTKIDKEIRAYYEH